MRYVLLLSVFAVGCATHSVSPAQIPSEFGHASRAGIYQPGPPPLPEDRSRFQSSVGENNVRDLEHPAK